MDTPSASPVEPTGHRALRRMIGRDVTEPHRVASTLELLFDLTFVVAFSFASNEFAHALAAGHVGIGLIGFALAMFGTCWAWINFSWFASAFDNDDWLYRVVTMVQMVGVLIFALGIAPMFASLEEGEHLNIRTLVAGYVVMRIAMACQWLRAARHNPQWRRACLTYVAAITVAQLGWVALAAANLTVPAALGGVAVLVLVEGIGPAIAERRPPTPWHPHHIAERYGLLAIISLGEGIVGTAAALAAVMDSSGGLTWQVGVVGAAGLGMTVAMWWSYFELPSGQALARAGRSKAFVWGYGQIVVFAAIAATGAGLHVAALAIEHPTGGGNIAAVVAVAVPLAVFCLAIQMMYSYLVGAVSAFGLLLLSAPVVVGAAAIGLAVAGVSVPICLLVLVVGPALEIIGYEARGLGQAIRRD